MRALARPHLLGVDDGPFEKFSDADVPIVAVMMEGADRVEFVATTRFPVDGPEVTAFLAEWVGSLRCRDSLHGLVLGGITIAGLGVVDAHSLAERLALPVLIVNRKDPSRTRLRAALHAADLAQRIELVDRAPEAFRLGDSLYVAAAGTDERTATMLVQAALAKAEVPEALRVAHLIGSALVNGESRGRV